MITQWLIFKKFVNFNLLTKILFYISIAHGIAAILIWILYNANVRLPLDPNKIFNL